MRRILLLPVAALLAMALAACGGSGHLGNLFFVIVVPPAMSATPYPTPAIASPRDPSWLPYGPPAGLPGGPHYLVATDGRLGEAVGLNWAAGAYAPSYEVFRKAARADAQWERIAATRDTQYLDQPLPDYKLFFYRVRALGPAGMSDWSNVDSGFAGRGGEPCVIRGGVTFPGGAGAPGVRVVLVGLGEEAMRVTGADGRFTFAALPPGRYIVAPFHPGLDFPPPYIKVDLGTRLVEDVRFTALHQMPLRRLSGFVFQYVADGTGEPQFTPMAGVTVEALPVGGTGLPFSTVTNEDGFYDIENLPLGAYRTEAVCESCAFTPAFAAVTVNGRSCPGRTDLIGAPIYLPRATRPGPVAHRR